MIMQAGLRRAAKPGESEVIVTTRNARKTITMRFISLAMGCITFVLPALADGPGNPFGIDVATTHPDAAATYKMVPNASAIVLMPELKAKAAPAWVKPGLRITFAGADGAFPGTGSVCIPDGHGHFKLPNGSKFNVVDLPAGSGRGITQADVLAVRDDAVVLDIKASVFNGLAGILTIASESGQTTTPSAAAGGWIHPDVLGKYLDINSGGMTSTRLAYPAAGKSHNAIWQQFLSDKWSSCAIYDIDTGLLLHHATFSTVPTKTLMGPNGWPVETGGQSYASYATLAGLRQIALPWTQGRLPRLLQELHQLSYDGQVQTVMPGGLPVPPADMHVDLKIVGRGLDFVQVHRSGSVAAGAGRIPFESDLVYGPAQLMPLAADPDDLAKLKQDQELDADPVTKVVTKVLFAGRDRTGQEVVTIGEAIPGENQQLSAMTYDRATGLARNFLLTNPFLHQVTQLSLTKRE